MYIRTQRALAVGVSEKQKMAVGGMSDEVVLEWERYWERVVKFLRGVMKK